MQRKDFTSRYGGSGFQSSASTETAIYAIWDTDPEFYKEVVYVGKTNQGKDERFKQHCKDKSLDEDDYRSTEIAKGDWTPFETATHEQYGIGEYGGKGYLWNKINALDKAKWVWFREPTGAPHNKKQQTKLTDGHFIPEAF